jgi:hypothetical protein
MITHASLYMHAVYAPLTGHVIRQERRPALGCKLCLAQCGARPREQTLPRSSPALATSSPRIPKEATPSTVAHIVESHRRLDHDLGKISTSPEPSSALDICDRGRPQCNQIQWG